MKISDPNDFFKYIIDRNIIDVINDKKKLLSLANDLFDCKDHYFKLLKVAIDSNVYKVLLEAQNEDSNEKKNSIDKAIMILIDSNFIDKDKATLAVGWFANTIFPDEWFKYSDKSIVELDNYIKIKANTDIFIYFKYLIILAIAGIIIGKVTNLFSVSAWFSYFIVTILASYLFFKIKKVYILVAYIFLLLFIAYSNLLYITLIILTFTYLIFIINCKYKEITKRSFGELKEKFPDVEKQYNNIINTIKNTSKFNGSKFIIKSYWNFIYSFYKKRKIEGEVSKLVDEIIVAIDKIKQAEVSIKELKQSEDNILLAIDDVSDKAKVEIDKDSSSQLEKIKERKNELETWLKNVCYEISLSGVDFANISGQITLQKSSKKDFDFSSLDKRVEKLHNLIDSFPNE